MALGLGVLGIAPSVFWSMTPKELEAAMRGRLGTSGSATPPTRSELAGLMERFPDDAEAAVQSRTQGARVPTEFLRQ